MEHNKKLFADRMVNFLLCALQKVDCFHLGLDNRIFLLGDMAVSSEARQMFEADGARMMHYP